MNPVRILRTLARIFVLAILASTPAWAANFPVSSDGTLRAAITGAANGDTITFTSNITLASSLPAVSTSVTIVGGGFTLDGASQYSAFNIQSTVGIQNLTIQNTLALGGNGGNGADTAGGAGNPGGGGGGGGGAAGLGGAVFVATGATATLTNVSLSSNEAEGGQGGGGGQGTGNMGLGGVGGTGGGPSGGAGGAAPTLGGHGGAGSSGGFASGGGGGGGTGGVGAGAAGNGGFGGGGGGGGGAAAIVGAAGTSGFGGGAGSGALPGGVGANGGGGAGLGGGIFVESGGVLNINGGGNISGNLAVGGAHGTSGTGGAAGSGIGSGIFLQGADSNNGGAGTLAFAPTLGTTETVADAIGDQGGNSSAGSWGVAMTGAGTLSLTGANSFSGGVSVSTGNLVVSNTTGSGTGTGTVTMASGTTLSGSGSIAGAVSLASGSTVSPGAGGTPTLTAGSLTWASGATAQIPLSAGGVSNELILTGALTKGGGGSTYQFNFQNSGATGTYTLATMASTTFLASDFSYTGLTSGLAGTFSIVGGTSLQFTVAVPAPAVQTSTPLITNVADPANGTYIPGQTLTFSLTFNQGVTVSGTGTPEIEVLVGSTVRYATYLGGSGTGTLTFGYTVQAGDAAPNGVTLVSPVLANGAVIQGLPVPGLASNVASLSFRAPNTSGIVIAAQPGSGTSTLAVQGTYGVALSGVLSLTNLPLPSTLTGILPSGLTFNSTTDVLSGTPTQTGVFTLILASSNSGATIVTLTINPAPQTISFTQGTLSSNAGPLALPATASSQLPVTYTVVSGPATVSGATLTLSGLPGIVTVRANQAGNANYLAAAPVSATFNIIAANPLLDVSIYGSVTAAQPAIVAGFVLAGSGSKPVVVRGVGPTLTALGVTGALAAPTLQLSGSGGLILSNGGWAGSSALSTLFAQVGAFPLVTGSIDAAATTTLGAGSYSLQVGGPTGTTGSVLAEVYDASANPSAQTLAIVNVSSLGSVAPGSPLTAGFVIGGSTPVQLLVRGVGPGLSAFGIGGGLTAPALSLYTNKGVLLAQNAGWATPVTVNAAYPGAAASAIAAATVTAGAFNLTAGSTDSVLLVTLPPGAYSAQVSAGSSGGSAAVGLIEVYEVP